MGIPESIKHTVSQMEILIYMAGALQRGWLCAMFWEIPLTNSLVSRIPRGYRLLIKAVLALQASPLKKGSDPGIYCPVGCVLTVNPSF